MHCSVCFTTSGSSHTLLVSYSPAGRDSSSNSSSSAGFRQGCLCMLHFGHTGWPHAFVPGDEEVEGGAGSLLTVSHTAAESSHLLCPLPAFHTASVPDWSMTPEPTATSSLPPHTHPKLHVCSYAKEFFSGEFLNCAFFNTLHSF